MSGEQVPRCSRCPWLAGTECGGAVGYCEGNLVISGAPALTPDVLAEALASASGHPGLVREATRLLAVRAHAALAERLGWA